MYLHKRMRVLVGGITWLGLVPLWAMALPQGQPLDQLLRNDTATQLSNASGAGSFGSVLVPLMLMCAVALVVLKQPAVQAWLRTWALNNGLLKDVPKPLGLAAPVVGITSGAGLLGIPSATGDSASQGPPAGRGLSALLQGASLPIGEARYRVVHREWMDATQPELGQWWVLHLPNQPPCLVAYTPMGVNFVRDLPPTDTKHPHSLGEATDVLQPTLIEEEALEASWPITLSLAERDDSVPSPALRPSINTALLQEPPTVTLPIWLAKARQEQRQRYPDD